MPHSGCRKILRTIAAACDVGPMISAFWRYQTLRLPKARTAERKTISKTTVKAQTSATLVTGTLSGLNTASATRKVQLQSVAICRTGPISSAAR